MTIDTSAAALMAALSPKPEVLTIFTAQGLLDHAAAGTRSGFEAATGDWVCDPGRAARAVLIAVVRNHYPRTYQPDHGIGHGPHDHIVVLYRGHTVFPSPGYGADEKRYSFAFKEFALIHTPVKKWWLASRNPVKYVPLSDLVAHGIDIDALDWRPVSELSTVGQSLRNSAGRSHTAGASAGGSAQAPGSSAQALGASASAPDDGETLTDGAATRTAVIMQKVRDQLGLGDGGDVPPEGQDDPPEPKPQTPSSYTTSELIRMLAEKTKTKRKFDEILDFLTD